MSTMIQIRHVPDELHRRAKERAAARGQTLSDFAMEALRRAVDELTLDEVSERIRRLGPVELDRPATDYIREERDRR